MWLPEMARQRRCSLVLAGDDVPEALGNGGGADGARLDEGKTGVRSSSSLASRSDVEAWPEDAWAAVCFG
jgi:hypothetical protein